MKRGNIERISLLYGVAFTWLALSRGCDPPTESNDARWRPSPEDLWAIALMEFKSMASLIGRLSVIVWTLAQTETGKPPKVLLINDRPESRTKRVRNAKSCQALSAQVYVGPPLTCRSLVTILKEHRKSDIGSGRVREERQVVK